MARINVIEDNFQSARLVKRLLKLAGHEVEVYESGEIGIGAILENKPDLALIDLGLPDLDGQTVIGVLRQHDALKGMPLVAFTSYPEATARAMAKAYGCDGVILKPVNTRTFARQVEAFLNASPSIAESNSTIQPPPEATSRPNDEPARNRSV